jgi:alpha-tubulin suppressor-like RCC1 family protein
MRRELWVLGVLASALVACGDDAVGDGERTRDADVSSVESGDDDAGAEPGESLRDAADEDAAVEEPGATEADGAAAELDGDVTEDAAVDLTACDELGEACCDEAMCGADLACAGSVCTCASQVINSLILRADGRLIDVQASAQSPIRNASTGQTLTGVVSAHRGHSHGCALRDDKSVWCWAAGADGNAAGQLGNGETAAAHPLNLAARVRTNRAPAAATYLEDVSALQQGFSGYYNSTSCARTADGSVWCWGAGTDGNVTQTRSNEPAAVRILASEGTPVSDAEEVTVGGRHACYRTPAGAVYCWGANVGGALGIGSDQAAGIYPVQVLGVGGAVRISAGHDFSCALIGEGEDAGRVLCWGHNNNGQIGNGPPESSTDGCANYCKTTATRVKIDSDTYLEDVQDIVAGYQGACAVKHDGSAWCWGRALGGEYATRLSVDAAPLEDIGQLTVHSREVRLLGADGSYQLISDGSGTPLDLNCGLLD